MAYSPSEKYPGAVDVDPDYQGGKFRDNNPSTTNNGSPLKAIDRNELLARDEAIMNDAGFEYNGLPDTPQDSQLFKAYKASLGNGANLLSNHNFLIQTPDSTLDKPDSTPRTYPAGYQIFSGVFANETTGITNLTYIDGHVSFSGGDFYMSVPNSGGLERLTDFVASVADFDGKPRTRGVSFALVGDEYRVTVGVDALEDVAANPTPLGSVKFEHGSVATGHETQTPKGQSYDFTNVSDMILYGAPLGANISTSHFKVAIKQSWRVVLSVEPGGYGVALPGGTFAQLITGKSVSPSEFGAGRDQVDYSSEIQRCFDFAEDNNVQVTGHGSYYVSSGVVLKSDFSSFGGMNIVTLSDFAENTPVDIEELGRRVIIIDKPNAQVNGLRAVNDGMVGIAVGMDYAQHQIKSQDSGGSGFKVNSLVRSFSIKVTNGRNTTAGQVSGDGFGYNLLAYAPESSKEINALVIDGGEYFESNGIAIDIGDTRNLMATTLGPSDFHGTGVRIVNSPTCDQGQIRIDKVLNVFVDVYTEKSTASLPDDAALVLGGAFNDSLRGVEIIGYATDFKYFALCKGGVSGINMHNTRSRNIAISALYLTTDQYDYTYKNNQSTNSFTEGLEVHTGVRSGVTASAWDRKTIDAYDLYDGDQKLDGEQIYPNKNVTEGNINYRYNIARYRYYKTPRTAACTISGNNTVVFNSNTDVKFFNGGDAVNFSGAGGALSYVLSVDYENATMQVDTFAYSGSGNIEQQSVLPRIERTNFQPEPSTNFQDSSIVWNSYTVDTSTIYWILKQGAWVAKT